MLTDGELADDMMGKNADIEYYMTKHGLSSHDVAQAVRAFRYA